MPLSPDKMYETRGNYCYKVQNDGEICEVPFCDVCRAIILFDSYVAAAVKELREQAYCWHNGCNWWAERARPECFECHLQDVKIDCQELNKIFGSVTEKEKGV